MNEAEKKKLKEEAREVLEEKVEEKLIQEVKVEKNDTHDYMQTFSNRRKKVSLLSSIGESITTGIDTLNSEIYTLRETLELTRNILQDSIEQSKLDLINTKKKAVATYIELGFSVEDISKELDWDIDIIQNILKEQIADSESFITSTKYLSTSEEVE